MPAYPTQEHLLRQMLFQIPGQELLTMEASPGAAIVSFASFTRTFQHLSLWSEMEVPRGERA